MTVAFQLGGFTASCDNKRKVEKHKFDFKIENLKQIHCKGTNKEIYIFVYHSVILLLCGNPVCGIHGQPRFYLSVTSMRVANVKPLRALGSDGTLPRA